LEIVRMDGPHYGGPGRGFVRRPTIRHSISRTLVSQWGGLDI
jgi:hypothetical protein